MLQYLNSTLLVAIFCMLLKLYAEHVTVRFQVKTLWRWWVNTYRGGEEPRA